MKDYYEWKAEKASEKWSGKIPVLALELQLLSRRNISFATYAVLGSVVGYFVFLGLHTVFLAHVLSIVLLAVAGLYAGRGFSEIFISGRLIAAHYNLPASAWKEFCFIKPEKFAQTLSVAKIRHGVTVEENQDEETKTNKIELEQTRPRKTATKLPPKKTS